ncbi:unnamed protein product [Vicia faba]|uniref:Uncharacterized protein n=1 Tax=Vicia faba TaxID=3906 RepID=A0AAV1B083_VICFA|nr:unnamed protein product [Vicia faba]
MSNVVCLIDNAKLHCIFDSTRINYFTVFSYLCHFMLVVLLYFRYFHLQNLHEKRREIGKENARKQKITEELKKICTPKAVMWPSPRNLKSWIPPRFLWPPPQAPKGKPRYLVSLPRQSTKTSWPYFFSARPGLPETSP